MASSVSGFSALIEKAMVQTCYMTVASLVFSVVLGGALGLMMYLTAEPLFYRNRALNQLMSAVVNIIRSLPFLILMIFVLPLSKFIVGTKIGPDAVIVPLTIWAIAFFARLAEASFAAVSHGVIEAYVASGASTLRVVVKILLPEARIALLKNITVTLISVIGSSAMAGLVGGGGLGDLAYRYGYQQYRTDIMLACVIILIIMVQLIQLLGDGIVARIKRKQ
ncbi:MAG: methionine ABC transporter permease [Selenomonadaceae bacterium]